MAVYNTLPAIGMYPGDVVTLSNASLGGANLTQQVAPANMIAGAPTNLTVVNKSTATLTIEVAQSDVQADYQPLQGAIVPPDSALSFSTTAPFVAVLPSADPGTGLITICR